MFHMVNEFGNVHRHVPSEAKRDKWLAQGYREVVVKEKKSKPALKAGNKARDEA